MKRLFCIFILLSISFSLLQAVPAYPGPIRKKQPNGEFISIRMRGDERYHYTTTEDGFLIKQNKEGYYCYAKRRSNGKIVATKKIAHNYNQRDEKEFQFILRIKERNDKHLNHKK